MPTINQLSATDTLTASDLFAIYSSANGDARKVALSVLLAYMQDNLTFSSFVGFVNYKTQYYAPSGSGFNITITPGSGDEKNVHLILTPTAGFALGTITLPTTASLVDKQEVIVNCTQQVTALTVDGNLSTVTGEPTSLGADDFFRLKYDLLTNTWYRVG